MEEAAPDQADVNDHVRKYLSYYMALPHAPNYAVMLNGAWGIGKTYLVKRILQDYFGDQSSVDILKEIGAKKAGAVKEKARGFFRKAKAAPPPGPPKERKLRYVYVSLYGLKSPKEINSAILTAMYPALSLPGVNLASRILNTVASGFSVESDLSFQDFFREYEVDLYVFDDLERCEMPINVALGYINRFVEHQGRKVMLVAHEDEIKPKKKYRKIREKLIGKTLLIKAAFNGALDHFLTLIADNATRAYLTQNKAEINEVYHEGGLENLRILQQTMWDFERVFLVLDQRHRNNEQAMPLLMRLLFALSFELRRGNLDASDLRGRMQHLMARAVSSTKGPPSRLAVANEKYKGVELGDNILSDDLLIEVLVNGVVDGTAIRAYLDRHPYFKDPETEKPWRVVWYGRSHTEEQVDAALAAMQRQYDAREFVVPGEMLHVFGLRLFLGEVGVLTATKEQIVADAKLYIDDLLAANRLEPLEANMHDGLEDGGYDGLQIFEADSAEMKAIRAYMRQKRVAAAERRYPDQAAALLGEMKTDANAFYKRTNWTSDQQGTYARIPILPAIAPQDFVQTLLSLHPEDQRTIFRALRSRYEGGKLKGELAEERAWLTEVAGRLVEEADKRKPYTRWRIKMSVESSLHPVLAPTPAAAT